MAPLPPLSRINSDPAGSELIGALRARLGAMKVLSDQPAMRAYSADASIYTLTPRAVVLAESADDVAAALAVARERGAPITARSGGTNLTGSAIGEGIILDCSRMRRLLTVDAGRRLARVEPGIVYAELNRELAASGLQFAPDPSSGEMCKLGGMVANNSAGPRTLKYGAVKDNLVSLEVMLADGSRITARSYRLDEPELARLKEAQPWVAGLVRLVREHRADIVARRPTVSKNSSGYNLFALSDGLDEGRLDLHQLFIGSEGTLGVTLEATLALVPRPAQTVTALLFFERMDEVGHAVNELLALAPSALEMLDGYTLDLIGRPAYRIPASSQAMLLAEFDEGDPALRESALAGLSGRYRLSEPPRIATEPQAQADLWAARKAIYPTLYRYDAKKKPINFADDVVVTADRLPDLIDYLRRLFAGRGVAVAVYGHIGNGNAHLNPLLDLNDPADVETMAAMAREIHSTVIERFGGSICGEHGDGRVRAGFVRAYYGDALYRLFEEVKRLIDPAGLLNPGVKLSDAPLTAHLDRERLTTPCASCGKCNAVCPVYDVEREESNAARGWYRILTSPDYSYEASSRVVEACLNCKSCRTVCPAGIDVSEAVLERRAERPNRTAGRIFWWLDHPGLFEPAVKLLGWSQPLWDHPAGRRLIDLVTRPWLRGLGPEARLSPEIALPRFARRLLRERHRPLTEEGGASPSRGSIAYFHGCAANYFQDGVGDAVIRLLRKTGATVVLPRQRCSGTPIETYGHRELVRRYARENLDSLLRFDTVVTGCASCTFKLKDYAGLFDEPSWRARAAELSRRVRHISEYLEDYQARQGPLPLTAQPASSGKTERVVTYHSSCHLRAAGVSGPPRRLLQQVPGARYVEMADADRCAGGAGTFLVKQASMARRIFARKAEVVERSGATVVATSCPACMMQLATGLKGRTEVRHVAQLIDEAWRE
ncbi:MAG TPA: FAD-binding and (Fe-S)-binding domain-containing protein [Nitrospiria bacterium]|nr:FAD-binding and (Fe-S)-binding domain-containing protein [Nitrospiria bacterium]